MSELMVYGCNGYTGRLVTTYAKSLGLNIVLAGRTEDKVRSLADELVVEHRIFDLSSHDHIVTALGSVQVLLNCSGPFKHTASPLMRACIQSGTHYLDISAELDSYQLAEELDVEAKAADVVLMPGCGGSVAMLGCLTSYALERTQTPSSIDIALRIAGPLSHGSLVTASDSTITRCLKRVDGAMTEQDPGVTTTFDFDNGEGSVPCFPISLPDLVTLYASTGVPDIRTYAYIAGKGHFSDSDTVKDGPTGQEREGNPYFASVIITDRQERKYRAVLETVNGYTFTSQASVHAAKVFLEGVSVAGFKTPAGFLGYRFVESVPGTSMRRVV
ncbi:saccharopine dehydrogenase NADP binding domain-containing protein [Sarocladium implicatum]|nr:saccharopine dehydrogenase NADP binding domain-containing protein [Sarocladium implicatum]